MHFSIFPYETVSRRTVLLALGLVVVVGGVIVLLDVVLVVDMQAKVLTAIFNASRCSSSVVPLAEKAHAFNTVLYGTWVGRRLVRPVV